MIRLIIYFLLFSLVIAVPPLVVGYIYGADYLAPNFWYMFLFYFIVTFLVCAIVVFGQQLSDKTGAQLFLIGTTVKLLACMSFAIVYVRYIPINTSRFILSFFYLYFLNTAFEIYLLLSNLRVQNKK